MVAGILAGAFIGFIAGVLKATRGVHEVITTIMLNYIAAGVTWWLVLGPLRRPRRPRRAASRRRSYPGGGPGRCHRGIPIGFVIAVASRRPAGGCCSPHHPRLPVQHRGREQARRALRRDPDRTDRHAVDGPRAVASAGLAGRSRRRDPLRVRAAVAAPSASTASPSRCSPGPTRSRRSPRRLLVGILRTGAAGLQFATGIAPEVVDLLLAIILLMVSIPCPRQVDLPQPGRQGQRRVDQLGELT